MQLWEDNLTAAEYNDLKTYYSTTTLFALNPCFSPPNQSLGQASLGVMRQC